MKNNNVILWLVLCLISIGLGPTVANGQVYKLGDLYTFEDGTKGVVFYVNPDDPTTGTVAALNDLDGQFALWSGVKPQALAEIFTPFGGISFRSIAGWESHGRRSTQVLAESGVSPAANAIESEGWYIPDVMQLYKLYASVAYLSSAFESYGGDISSLCTRSHWSSTIWRDPSEKAYSIASNMRLESLSGMTAKHVRLVRDFPDTASVQAYWTESRSSGDTVVSPSVTTSYGAVAVYRSDTLSLAAKVTVFWPASDTLYETVYASPQPYTSQVSDLFDGLDISLPGDYEYKDTLQTVHGCDSIVTLLLTVNNNIHYSDTLCSLKEDYYFAPFDTVFAAGTVSGVYEHHGTKTVDGVPVDTIAYYELTILPAYEQFDTTGWCLYESSETRRYEGDSRVTITVNGTSVTVSSETEEIVVEEIASVPGTTADFALRMQTVDGCDSVVFLHVDARRVERDTVRHVVSEHQVVDGRITVSGHTFQGITAAGVYELRDTLTAENGCDSIVTLLLTVVANVVYSDTLCPLKEDYYFAPFDTVFVAGTVSGVYEHHGTKTVEGVPVDTIAYYELTILPAYEQFDTIGWCLYEPSETRRYEGDSRVTITVNGTSVTVSSETEEIVVEEIVSVSGTTADFALRMQTVDGCDSVVFLHVDARRVERDTVRHVVSEHQVVDGRVTVSGHTFENITAAGVYELRDTLTAGNGCDSIVTLLLTVSNNVHYSDTLCSLKEDYYFAPFDTVFAAGTVSGVYEHHGTKTVDGVPVDTIAYYELTILPAYEQFDTIGWCLYESSETRRYEGDSRVSITANGTSVIVTSETEEIVVEEVASGPGLAADFALRMQTVDGCDSVVFLHVDARRVERDTVRHVVSEHQVVDGRVTVSGHTFEDITAAGVYELRDTLTAENGCDSIVTLLLTVSNNVHYSDTLCSLKDDYYFAPLDTVFAMGTVSGVYEHHGTKTVDGVPVDTIAYYELTILPAYEQFDTTGWCLYELSETRRYEGDSRVTITVNGTSVTVTSETEEIVVEEIASEPGSTADFALRMQTVDGCDSVVFLHVDARRVERDTVRHVVSEHQVVDGRITVSDHTFEDITAAGVYELRDTLTAGNGCDSIEVYELTVTPCVSDFSILCPPDVYDTLTYGDCVMTIYPERLGTPTVLYDGEWPFLISNDIPADYLFAQGDNVVTWTATDPECGNSVTCEQHVVIAFPQCPDAVDYEGNVYHGVRIGCNCWTQRNLESTKYSDGAEIAGRYAYANLQYPDTSANVAVFGRLYSFEAAVRDSADNGHGHIQGICPDGWFLPTPEHYESLNEYGTPALRSPNLWIVGAGDNSTGFTALPAGFYNGQLDRYEGLLTETYFWSTQNVEPSVAKHVYAINYYCDAVVEQHPSSGLGFSVRCIKEK